MFEAGLRPETDPALRVEADRAFAALREACAALAALAPAERRPPAHMMAYHMWALAHGVAALFGREGARAPISAEDLLESGSAIYLRGLGLLPPDA
jgi:hypothetical protein